MKNASLISVLAALSCLTVACGRNRDIDDYRRERVVEELAKIQEISGSYGGEVDSSVTNSSMGGLQIELESDTRVQTAPDGTKGEEVAVLKAKVTFVGANPLTIVFDGATYNSDTHNIKASYVVTRKDGSRPQLDLVAVVQNGKLEGTIEVRGFPNHGGKYNLQKGKAAEPTSSELSPEEGTRPAFNFERGYKGAGDFPYVGRHEVALDLSSNSVNGEEELVEAFSPVKNMRATLLLSGYLQLVFENAKWDQTSRQLSATTTISPSTSNGGAGTAVTLDCVEWASSSGEGWVCDFRNALRKSSVKLYLQPRASDFVPPSLPALTGNYRGEMKLPYGSDITVGLALAPLPENQENDFNDFIRLTKTLRATFILSNTTQIAFERATWFYDTRILSGETTVTVNSRSFNLRIECKGDKNEISQSNLDCRYQSALRNDEVRLLLKPAAPDAAIPQLNFAFTRHYVPGRGNPEPGSSLTVTTAPVTPANEILEVFDYAKSVRAVLDLTPRIHVSFPDAIWYKDRGVLIGRGNLVSGGFNYDLTIECAQAGQGWDCVYRSSLNGSAINLNFVPAVAAPAVE